MPKNDSTSENFLEAAMGEGTAYLRVHGRATFEFAPQLLEFIGKAVEDGMHAIFIDMGPCLTVDSTFTGVITSQTIRLREKKCTLKLFNVSSHVHDIFSTLGLDKILDIVNTKENEELPYQPMKPGQHSKIEVSRVMLDAHEALASVNESNAVEFKNVVTYLRKKLS